MFNSRLVFSSLLLLFLSFTTYSQKDMIIGKYSIKTSKGFLFGYNSEDDKSFTIEVTGDKLKPANDSENPTFTTKDRVIQVLIVRVGAFVPSGKKLNADETLQEHMKWEADFLGGEFGAKLKTESEFIDLASKKHLFWWFKRPKYNEEFDRDFMMTTLFGNKLVGISVSVVASETKEVTRTYLSDVFMTLKIFDRPVDVTKLSDEIKRRDGR